MLKGFIFDLDGVITSTAQMHFDAWKTTTKLLGVELEDKYEKELRGIPRVECLQKIIDDFKIDLSKTKYSFEWLLIFKNDEYLSRWENLSSENILENVVEILNYLKENNFKIGLASVSKNAELIISKLNLRNYFDDILNIEKIKKPKPDPEMFLTSILNLNLKIEEVIVVDDSEIGMETCKKGKIKSIGIGVCGNYSFDSMKDLKISEIKRIIEKEQN